MLNAAIRDILMPKRMARRPINDRGFPVPWFVPKVKGEWDFRAVDPHKMVIAYRQRLCWLCGEPLGQYLCFVIGPMCAVNRISSEPPSHRECAEYAARACPFLSKPRAKRNTVDLPDSKPMSGIHLDHNPGATLLWVTKTYSPVSDGRGGVLFQIGHPREVQWFAEGRAATRAEIVAAMDKGLPYLRELASIEGGEKQLEANIAKAMKLLPV